MDDNLENAEENKDEFVVVSRKRRSPGRTRVLAERQEDDEGGLRAIVAMKGGDRKEDVNAGGCERPNNLDHRARRVS